MPCGHLFPRARIELDAHGQRVGVCVRCGEPVVDHIPPPQETEAYRVAMAKSGRAPC